ncbi:fibronectin type III domain-containing protein [Streptomyces sp. UG1]|uniref:fibronectin type III domain-containing protein n=1 Tax=Streptomyces sp. UG1 TaxID=3417652 RepID=UPI003CF33C5D
MSRVGAVGAGLVLALGPVAAPAMAVQTAEAAAPAPTGLAYSYDEAGETVTVTWDPRDSADSVTRNYRVGLCGTPPGPCFVSDEVISGNSLSFHLAPGRTVYFKVFAENASHQLTGSEALTITT